MASLYKRQGRGAWIIQYVDGAGRRVQRSSRTTDKRAAERIAAKLEADTALRRDGVIDARVDQRAKAQAIGLPNHLDEYFHQCEQAGQARRHIVNKRSHLVGFVRASGAERITDFEPSSLRRHLSTLRESRSARTANSVRSSCVAFMSWCFKNGFVVENGLVSVPKFNEEVDRRRERRALTTDELDRLLVVAREQDRVNGDRWTPRAVIYTFAALTGLRRGEMKKLLWGDVDLEQGHVVVRASIGKARRDDAVPLHTDAVDALRGVHSGETQPSDPVFRTMPTIRTIYSDLERAGIPKQDASGRWADLHALRATLGTNLARQGVAPQIAQRIMRHSDYKTTLRHYTALTVQDAAVAIAKVPGVKASEGPEDDSNSDTDQCQRICQLTPHDSVRTDATPCVPGTSEENAPTGRNPLSPTGSGDSMRAGAAPRAKDATDALVPAPQLPKLNVEGSSPFGRSNLP